MSCHLYFLSRAVIRAHIDADAAMTGVSKFGERRGNLIEYSKREDITSDEDLYEFDWLLTSKRIIANSKRSQQYFSREAAVSGFKKVIINKAALLDLDVANVINIELEEMIFVYSRQVKYS